MQNREPEQGRVHRYWTRAAKWSPAPKYSRARYQSRVGVQLPQSRIPRARGRAEQDVGWDIMGHSRTAMGANHGHEYGVCSEHDVHLNTVGRIFAH